VAGVLYFSDVSRHHHYVTPNEAARILRADPHANLEQLHVAYLRRARETHPDRGGSAAAFRDVCEAYEVICADKMAAQTPEPEEVKLQDSQINSISWLRRRRWWLTILTLYVYVIAPHTGWLGNMPVPIITLNYVLRSCNWVIVLVWFLWTKPQSSRLVRWPR